MEHDRRLRGCLRGAITKAIATLEALLQDPAASEHRIQGTVDLITRKQTELRALDSKIQAELTDEAFEADFATAWDYEDNITQILARARSAARLSPSRNSPSDSAAGKAGPPQSASASTSRATLFASQVALPKHQIPSFSGDRRERQGFWERFNATIHMSPGLPKIEKF